MEYYVEKKDYIEAFKAYDRLTDEIALSNCTRYYHARNKFYRQMIVYMTEEYPEIIFLKNIRDCKFKIIKDTKYISDGDIITLEKEDGSTFQFKVTQAFDNDEYVIRPILPLIGDGESLFVKLLYEEDGEFFSVE